MILKSYLPAAGLSGLRKITQGFMQAYLPSVEKVSSFVMADDVKKIVRGCCIFCNNRRVALICGGGQSAKNMRYFYEKPKKEQPYNVLFLVR